jgi:hypothetical protein
MTTDRTSAGDRDARLDAVRQRRARRHAATGGRIFAGSLSAAAALGLMGAMADPTGSNSNASTATPAAAPAARAVIVIRRPAAATDVAVPATPRIVSTAAAPVATSRAS